MNPNEIATNNALDLRVAEAATETAWRRRLVAQAEEELQQRRDKLADAEAALAAVDPIQRAQKLLTRAHDAITELTTPEHPESIDLDNDPRPAQDQAADFFNRPGDYHQVRIEVPEATNADCVIKFTPEQQPLIVETLRQLRGALFARITLTRLDIASEQGAKVDTPQVEDCPCDSLSGDEGPISELGRRPNSWRCDECGKPHVDVVIDDGPPIPMSEFTLGDRYSETDSQRRSIADQYGVPIEHVQPAPSPTGDTAWTVRAPATHPQGRHAKPDDDQLEPWQANMLNQIAESRPDHIALMPPQHPQHRPINTDAIHDAAYGHDDQ